MKMKSQENCMKSVPFCQRDSLNMRPSRSKFLTDFLTVFQSSLTDLQTPCDLGKILKNNAFSMTAHLGDAILTALPIKFAHLIV